MRHISTRYRARRTNARIRPASVRVVENSDGPGSLPMKQRGFRNVIPLSTSFVPVTCTSRALVVSRIFFRLRSSMPAARHHDDPVAGLRDQIAQQIDPAHNSTRCAPPASAAIALSIESTQTSTSTSSDITSQEPRRPERVAPARGPPAGAERSEHPWVRPAR